MKYEAAVTIEVGFDDTSFGGIMERVLAYLRTLQEAEDFKVTIEIIETT